MLVIHETDHHGVTHTWEMATGQCPRCGAACLVDFPVTPSTPVRILCGCCSYSRGYSYSDEPLPDFPRTTPLQTD